MSKYPDYISEKRRPVPTPDSIVENGQAHFGTFDKPFKNSICSTARNRAALLCPIL